jgi:hypothetical protein
MVRTLTGQLEHTFEPGVNPEHAENFIRKLDHADPLSTKVLLRFEGYPYINPGVGWRVGNALRRFSSDGVLQVVVPPFGKGDWFRTFTRSGLGDAIATHASVIQSEGREITEEVKEFYQTRATRQDQNAVFFGELHRGASVNPEKENLFREVVLGALRHVNVKPSFFGRDYLPDVIKLSFEAIQNVYDHARRKPLPEGTKVVSYFLLGYYKSITGHPDPTGLLRGYVERLATTTKRVRTDYIQVCVNDDGVGIAARQSQDLGIYQGPREAEEIAVREAFTEHSSVKLVTQDCRIRGTPGQGYTYINASLKALKAFAVLRTGRLLAAFDGSEEGTKGFSLAEKELGYMPGTTLDVLIPILKDPEVQPTLFPDP